MLFTDLLVVFHCFLDVYFPVFCLYVTDFWLFSPLSFLSFSWFCCFFLVYSPFSPSAGWKRPTGNSAQKRDRSWKGKSGQRPSLQVDNVTDWIYFVQTTSDPVLDISLSLSLGPNCVSMTTIKANHNFPIILMTIPSQVRTASERFLAALENRWQSERSVLMPPLADILLEHTRWWWWLAWKQWWRSNYKYNHNWKYNYNDDPDGNNDDERSVLMPPLADIFLKYSYHIIFIQGFTVN